MAERVYINDVGPRDGLQNQAKILTVAERIELINSLLEANVDSIEVGAFVSPKAVPAMAGSNEVALGLNGQQSQAQFSALVPNLRGYEMAVESGIRTVAMVLYGSDTMAEKNVRMTPEQAEQSALDMLQRSRDDGVAVIATIAVSFECPFDGATNPDRVREITTKFLQAGAERIVIADTIGAANPSDVASLSKSLVADNGAEQIACHFHDTRALGMANLYAAVEAGIRHFDASIAGLGGCPFAPGATGNIATEDAVMMLHSMGYDTGIDLNKLLVASDLAETLTGSAPGGRSKPWLAPYLAKGKAV